PSPDLLDTIYQCQQRQEWYRGYAQTNRIEGHSFVGSCTLDTTALDAAEDMRRILSFSTEDRGSTWSEAFRRLTENAEDSGILVMVNGVVGNNTHRKLDPMEFRGFALVDPLAPVVFVNGADTRAAQVFTLAHELAHIWLGQTGLDDIYPTRAATDSVERWCNDVAAEFLVPRADLSGDFLPEAPFTEELDRLARVFKVSTLVIVRRLHETGFLTWKEYQATYEAELARVLDLIGDSAGRGGNFYNTQPVRVSKLFARSVIASTREGQTLHRDAFRMLGFKKLSTFNELSDRLGVT
ncbi:MAG: ImmA/IrrE family metallo-endopeptidase, partial [Acidimicrobiia bacterium]